MPIKEAVSMTYYLDTIVLDIINGESFKDGKGNTVLGGTVEYGTNMTINVSAFDTYWTEDNISAVMVEIRCVEGTCLQNPLHNFWLDEYNETWGRFIDTDPADYVVQDPNAVYGDTNFLPGSYNVTITAWDGYAEIEKADHLPDSASMCNNNTVSAGSFDIVDTTPADAMLEFGEGDYVDSKQLQYNENTDDYSLISEDGLKRFGFELGRRAKIMVRASEPIEVLSLQFSLKEDTECRAHLSYDTRTEDKRVWTYEMTIPDVPCFRDIQDTGNSLGNNTQFIISFNDSAGNVVEDHELGNMEIDTKAPYIKLIEPNHHDELMRSDRVNITGIVSYDGMYEEMPDREAVVFIEGGHIDTTDAKVAYRLFPDKNLKINHAVDENESTLSIVDSSVDCSDTDGITEGQYIGFDQKRRYQTYYRIIHVSDDQSCVDNDYRLLTLDSDLENPLDSGAAAYIYDNSHPMGWFQFNVPLAEGVNEFNISAMDDLENMGEKTSFRVMRDTTPPYIQVFTPRDGDIISENEAHVNFSVKDDFGGIDASSVIFTIETTNESGTFTSSYECGDSQSSGKIAGTLSCDEGHDVNASFAPEYLNDGSFKIIVNATDVLGYPIQHEWGFIVNSEVPASPVLDLQPYGGRKYEAWYTRHNSTDLDLVFNASEVIGIQNVTIGGRELECSNKDSSYRFRCSIGRELAEDVHDIEITARRLKFGEEDYEGRDGRWTLSFEVDVTHPKVTAAEIPASREYLNRTLKGKAEDENMHTISISGDTLYEDMITFIASGSFEKRINISPSGWRWRSLYWMHAYTTTSSSAMISTAWPMPGL